MRKRWSIGRIAGLEIALHASWLFMALLLLVSLAYEFQTVHPLWSAARTWTVAAFTTALFFVSLLLHEFGHAAVARARGLPVRGLLLFAFGGMAELAGDSDS